MANKRLSFYVDRKKGNDPAFNKKVKKRREHDKMAQKSRKINRKR